LENGPVVDKAYAKPPYSTQSKLAGNICPICFRPTGLAFDSKGRLFMASEKTGEIWVIGRADGSSVDSVTLEGPGSYKEERGVRNGAVVLNARKESAWGTLWKMLGH
jgi:hypothetical protein